MQITIYIMFLNQIDFFESNNFFKNDVDYIRKKLKGLQTGIFLFKLIIFLSQLVKETENKKCLMSHTNNISNLACF